jgi:hypothetical protein
MTIMRPIMLILLAMPSLCYAHGNGVIVLYMFGSTLPILLFLLLFLFVKNEKSENSFKVKLAIRSILIILLIAAIVFIIMWDIWPMLIPTLMIWLIPLLLFVKFGVRET